MKHHFALLGFKVKDTITGFTGTCTTIGFDLYGCVQGIVSPAATEDGKIEDGRWFDLKRLAPVSEKPVMEVPTFETVPGGAEKPKFAAAPIR